MNNTIILLFSSNTEGRHGKGLAKWAKDEWQAEYGNPKGLQGNSYAIITKDLSKGERSISLNEIEKQIEEFWRFTLKHPKWIFLIPPIGCNLAGYTLEEIKPLFLKFTWLSNVYFQSSFIYEKFK